MKIPTLFQDKKLRATTARRPLRIAAAADYDEMSEPNMKLSRALLIVLVLHVVAVSGIIAFNAIKTRQRSIPPPARAANTSALPVESNIKPDPSNSHPAIVPKENARPDEVKPPHSSVKQIAGKNDRAKSMAPTDSGKVYVVAKGDKPVTIAKKLKVSYDDLLALNHIEDPRKLRIGQKLLIPSKNVKAKKTQE